MDQNQAVDQVMTYVAGIAEQGWTYRIEGVREHPSAWGIGVRPYNPNGDAAYDLMGFDVDKITGEVSHWK